MGNGPVSRIMIIGEAPGKEEDEKCEPFVGKSGILLNQTLSKNGIKREDVYVTNVVKCRPPNNRKPTDEESLACSTYLLDEYLVNKPDFILLLGNTPLHTFTMKEGIVKSRGIVNFPDHIFLKEEDGYAFSTKLVYATLHPSAALRSIRYKEYFEEDIKNFANLFRNMK